MYMTFNRQISSSKFFLIIIILILLIAVIFLAIKYNNLNNELKVAKTAVESQKINTATLNFTKLFISKVLKAESEIDFDTRLTLENAVRNLNDSDVLAQWQKFTGSKDEAQAQQEVKALLEMLVNKIEVK